MCYISQMNRSEPPQSCKFCLYLPVSYTHNLNWRTRQNPCKLPDRKLYYRPQNYPYNRSDILCGQSICRPRP